MEQRNLIVAMVLMGLIWVTYFTFFAPQTTPPEQAPAPTAQPVTSSTARTAMMPTICG